MNRPDRNSCAPPGVFLPTILVGLGLCSCTTSPPKVAANPSASASRRPTIICASSSTANSSPNTSTRTSRARSVIPSSVPTAWR